MEHTILLTSIDNRNVYVQAAMILSFTRNADNTTMIQFANGMVFNVKTTAEKVDEKLNKYMDDVFIFNLKNRRD